MKCSVEIALLLM
ncbi:hypothetical protein CGLO_00440 [Colletotrichum gloeosporioides Cg-14]|uniref:Uncharacterized protein n=1 Tax=Colletotrichum gloeosporioides (strain Cg-14) TaxID=1237896 RepID=T0L353_COLGC|nr:hypothetical protein CGLO_00440 [Colletotrichum gloeosporioides Cg-14]